MKEITAIIQPFQRPDAIEVIQKRAHTGNPGDGKIFVYDVQEVVKIRTNERGEKAV